MHNCPQCEKPTSNPKFCSRSCAAKMNNKLHPKRPQRQIVICRCGLRTPRNQISCSRACNAQRKQEAKIVSWMSGEITGLDVLGCVTNAVKRWLRDTRGDACEICGWNEVNHVTGKVPVVADHIDGNWQNNRPDNLRLICPNCDSLSPTYKALNRGNGRTLAG